MIYALFIHFTWASFSSPRHVIVLASCASRESWSEQEEELWIG